jgi:hypothetical protein
VVVGFRLRAGRAVMVVILVISVIPVFSVVFVIPIMMPVCVVTILTLAIITASAEVRPRGVYNGVKQLLFDSL